jgi:hypothetical protein
MQTIHSSKIKNLITKFFYKENHLCFQILLNCENNETRLFKEYTDYAKYKEEYNRLLDAKTANDYILIGEEGVSETHLSFM